MITSELSRRFHEIINAQTTSLTPNNNRNCKLLGLIAVDSDVRLEILAQIPSGTQIFLFSLLVIIW